MEETISDLQAQIDRLSLAVRQWLETQQHLEPMEQRLSQVTERCAEILSRWSDTDQRHAQAVSEVEARLSEWAAIESRLQQDSLQRIREFESNVEHEWQALRQIHEEPAKQLREQAAALGETCVAAANLALRGFERAEARFAALETDLQERLGQLSRDVQAALAEVRREGRPPPLGAGVAPFPLEGVMRIHEELRDSGGSPPHTASTIDVPARQLPEAAAALSDRMQSLEREVTSGKEEARETATRSDRLRRDWRLALVAGGVAILIAAFFAVRFQRQVTVRLDDAAARVTAAERQAETAADAASRQIASTRADADRQIAEARQAALKAEIVSNLLAAPDLIRFNLTGTGEAERAYAQVLWSRTRGMVVSGSRLPAAPAGSTYQVWLMTDTEPVSAGLLVPDATGRVTLATDTPPSVPRRVIGAAVTLEPAGGRPSPSGVTVLSRAPQ